MKMTPKDMIYNFVFKDLMSKNLNQKQAGDAAARAVNFYSRGTTHKDAIKKVMDESKPLIKSAKKTRSR